MTTVLRRKGWLGVRLFFAAMIALPSVAARADNGPVVPVRVGSHEGYGRVVFDLPSRTDYRVTQQGQIVVLQFGGDLSIGSASARPRNVVAITGGAGQAEIVVAPGTTLRDWRLGDRVVIDVLDGPAGVAGQGPQPARAPALAHSQTTPTVTPTASPTPPASTPPSPPTASPTQAASTQQSPPTASPTQAAPTLPSPPTASPTQAASSLPSPQPATSTEGEPTTPPTMHQARSEPEPVATPAPSLRLADPPKPPAAPLPEPVLVPPATTPDAAAPPAVSSDTELVVPSDTQLGVAAFRRGGTALIVLDQRRTIDLTPLRDHAVFGTATVLALPTATVIRVQLDLGLALSANRSPGAWRVAAVPQEAMPRPIGATVDERRILLTAAAPGTVVTMMDPDTGAPLLVGTQRRDGQGIPAQRRTPEFTLLPTWQGVAVEATAETVALRPTTQGFVLSGDLVLSSVSEIADPLVRAVGLTRQFDFPSEPTDALVRRLSRQVAEDAVTPPLARGPRRQDVARTMVALGLGAEAGAMLRMAAADDPNEAASPENAALAAIAALLAHRPNEADGLTDRRLQATDDIAMWRAVRLAQLQEGSPTAAALFAATLPLLLAYPPAMRDRLLPLVAETLVSGGETEAAGALLKARPEGVALNLARGMLLEAQGESAQALALYDRLTQSRDQAVHARASARAVELRLASGAIDARQAVDRLESLLYAWRGDHHERALRTRLAGLKAQAGAWRSALALLREGEALFPEDRAAIHSELADTFAALLQDSTAETLAPLELVSVVEENADLLPTGPAGETLQARLADRLLALDLPKRAGPVLEKLMHAATSGVSRAGFGGRLAALHLREGDATGALAALDASVAADLPTDLLERRILLLAEAHARRGDHGRALDALSSLDSAAADEARAGILERAEDWAAAQRALTAYTARTVPPAGKLDDPHRRILLRLATAAARAGDNTVLADLHQRESTRMGSGPLGGMFNLLTADQVRSVADLKRSGQEAALARALPSQLKALQPPAGQTR